MVVVPVGNVTLQLVVRSMGADAVAVDGRSDCRESTRTRDSYGARPEPTEASAVSGLHCCVLAGAVNGTALFVVLTTKYTSASFICRWMKPMPGVMARSGFTA